jgi:LPS export ABC transporter protein LptC
MLTVLILTVLFLLPACSRSRDAELKNEVKDAENLPAYKLQDVTHYQYEEGILRLELTFERGSYFTNRDELRVENCSFVYYDIDGEKVSTGSSKEAVLFKNKSLLIAQNDVVVVSEVNRGKLETEYLEWKGKVDRFVTDQFVTMTRENGDTLQGIGMITDVALNYVTIKKDVKGSFGTE